MNINYGKDGKSQEVIEGSGRVRKLI